MNYFFKNKANVLLTCLLIVVIVCGGVLGYFFLAKDQKIIVPDFTDKNKSEVEVWCKSFDTNPCTINTDYSDSIKEDYVIYQSIAADNELVGEISFIVSLGKKKIIELPSLNNATKQDIENWASDNGLKNITFINENSSTIEKDFVIRIEPSSNITTDSSISVYISIGKNEDKSNTITVASGKYIDITVKEFETIVKNLGLNPVHSEKRDDYSSTIEKDKIVWHGSGDYIKDETIHYGISLGDDSNSIKIEKGTYIGKTLKEFKDELSKLSENGLNPVHNEDWDEESSTIEKGNIVFHGYGAYVDGEDIRYGLSLGSNEGEIIIKEGEYVDKTYAEFEKIIKDFGLVPKHKESLDVKTSNEDKIGKISNNGYGSYLKGESCSYGLYISSSNNEIEIKRNQYVGKTYADFESSIKSLGLIPYHRSDWDEITTDESKVGTICFNGSGIYTKGENCSYGLYLESSNSIITIKDGQYVGYSESEYKNTITALGLIPTHVASWDVYSDTVAKGKIVRNGYGDYTKGESSSYGLSLGAKPTVKEITINANAYNGLSNTEFENTIKGLGLNPVHNSNKDSYNSANKNTVIYHDSGTFAEGSTLNYGVSLGIKSIYLNTRNFYNTNYMFNNYTDMKDKMSSLLSDFSNISFEQVQSANTEIGQIEYIKVNGSTSYDPGKFNSDTPIVIGIVSSKKPS